MFVTHLYKNFRVHVRANNAQLEMMISYMESDDLFARGQITSLGKSGSRKNQKMWEELTAKLNQLGRNEKSVTSWQTDSQIHLKITTIFKIFLIT